METSDSETSTSNGQELVEDAGQPGPNQDGQCPHSKLLHGISKVLLETKAQNKQLASENAALTEQMAIEELIWGQEKTRLMKALESTRASRKEMDQNIKERKEIHSLKQTLRVQQEEIIKVTAHWTREYDKVTAYWKEENDRILNVCRTKTGNIIISNDKIWKALDAEWENRWFVRQEEIVTELRALQQDMDKKVSQVILEKEDLITKLDEKTAEVLQSKAECEDKLKALDDQLKSELAAKEQESLQRAQELDRERQKMEEEWLNKISQMEEKIQLLMQNNAELQELAQKTDKEGKKAKKDAEKRLKKEKKEREAREKKEKAENEKKQKERIKREKK